MADSDYNRLAFPAELINLDPYDPTRAEFQGFSDVYYWLRYAIVPQDTVIYVKMDLAHFDQAQMFDI